jgi:hypothetical protein
MQVKFPALATIQNHPGDLPATPRKIWVPLFSTGNLKHSVIQKNEPLPCSPKYVADIVILIAVIALGAAGYWLAPLLLPKTDVNLPLSACNLNTGPCSINLPDGGKVEVAIDPRPIPALKPLRLLAIANGARIEKIEIDFAGVDMKMGYNRPQLESLGDGRFAGQGSLPVCITGKMPWEATVLIEIGRTVIAAPFRFDAEG